MDKFKNKSPFHEYVVGINKKVPLTSGKLVTYINFDNAATTPPLTTVMKTLNEFAPWYSSIHRGKGYKSQLSSNLYEETRNTVAEFVNADRDYHNIIFVSNTTEAINKLSYHLCQNYENCLILSTDMEHHSNDLPWRDKYKLDYISLDNTGHLSLRDLKKRFEKYGNQIKLVTVTGASNVTGYKNPIYKIARIAHQYQSEILVDGAQLIPHTPFNMNPATSLEHIDYVVFSAHKMYAPFGTGVLIGPRKTFNQGQPASPGGGTVKLVTHNYVSWQDSPHKEEAGTPNLMGVVALKQALETLTELDLNKIAEYEHDLKNYALKKINNIPDIQLYVNANEGKNQVAIIPFNVKKLDHEITATILAQEFGIAVRNGCFCAQPYIQKLMKISHNEIKKRINRPDLPHPGLVRISLAMYNDKYEIDKLIEALHKITDNKRYYLRKYNNYSRK